MPVAGPDTVALADETVAGRPALDPGNGRRCTGQDRRIIEALHIGQLRFARERNGLSGRFAQDDFGLPGIRASKAGFVPSRHVR